MSVVLVTLDGVRADAIQAAHTPHLSRVMSGGAHTLNAQSVMPTMTLPCHMSIFHSVPPQRHGILTNSYYPLARPLPGLFEQIHAAGKRSASYFGWDPLRDLARPLMVTRTFHVATDFDDLEHADHPLVDAVVPHIATSAYDFYFVHLVTADEIGHIDGWMSERYLRQIEVLDMLVGRLINVLPTDGAILIAADHGGHDRNHGTDLPEDMTIPWMLYGDGVRAGYAIQSKVTLLDTAPTIAHLLDVPTARQWEGRVVGEALG